MSYNHDVLVRRILALLDERPALSAQAIADRLGVHRQTVTRALRGKLHQSFKDYQAQRMFAVLRKLDANGRETSWKLVADDLGCSTRSLTRWLTRYRRVQAASQIDELTHAS